MGNRADRRAAAKIAKQAVKRAKTPTEGAILRAAVAFAKDEGGFDLGTHLSAADFDETWERVQEDLRDILDDRHDAFVTEAYGEACLGMLQLPGADGGQRLYETRLFLCPVAGPDTRIAELLRSKVERERLAASLRESGLVSEAGRCLVFPRLFEIDAFAPEVTGPGGVLRLHERLAAQMRAALDGAPDPFEDEALAKAGEPEAGADFGAIAGLELRPAALPRETPVTEEEDEAESLARLANAASWGESYVATLPGIAMEPPLDWPACAAALAWRQVEIGLAKVRFAWGVKQERPEVLHCAPSADGATFVFSAIFAGKALGPVRAPADLAWLDIEEFLARAEASAEELVEHRDESGVLAPLRAG